ncbi:hypothetical protein P170DRAFT_472224 [Aspergillus steynii IBT 23096]|uniref:DUF6536 domain-containing protein n=1 Tax=Aspergillus steynii IBT 23096 TaxID=1392250 RepID=A0A2I2GHG6_9EURO|nr:uncharacterized protein P170DRAFT_472224 [Aspergillus steynii IBT 23096]PLB52320.1 hypothetical protein P170DRAFT_472224 [Aspergillus steynii IBT 23096]
MLRDLNMQYLKTSLITKNDEESPIRAAEFAQSNFKTRALGAWRFTVASGAFAGVIILLINITTLAMMHSKHEVVNQSITFFTGSCRKAKDISIGSHVVINVLSTILLAYSNFSMQCLSSPTRREVDRAHSKKHWLSIGIPSVRNLFFISKTKVFLWTLLALSSFPLHLIWNSTVFWTTSTNDYISVTVTESFLHGGDWTLPPFNEQSKGAQVFEDGEYNRIIRGLQDDVVHNRLERLSAPDCYEAYHTEMLSDRLHVLAVVDNSFASPTKNNTELELSSVLAAYYNRYAMMPLYRWVCDSYAENWWDTCLTSGDPNQWVPGGRPMDGETLGSQRGAPVKYCFSQRIPAQCKTDVIPVFLIIVIVCNVVKVACFLFTLRIVKKDHPLCTTGDAVQSFLERPDEYTNHRCLASKHDFEKLSTKSKCWETRGPGDADIWTDRRHRWGKAVRTWQWVTYTVLVSIMVILTGVKICDINSSWAAAVRYGIGEPHPGFESLDFYIPNTLRGFLTANTPQLMLSYVYLGLNNIMTTMLAMDEWCGYSAATSKPPKGLRVSNPAARTAQRSTYFLSVPYKWSVPSIVTLTALHWLVSQMFFYARLDVHSLQSGWNKTKDESTSYIYVSPLAGLLAACLGGLIVIIVVLIGIFKRYPATPLAGCCSASIAAACSPSRALDHGIAKETFPPGLPFKELKWGEVESLGIDANVGHATFSNAETTPLVKGKLYE